MITVLPPTVSGAIACHSEMSKHWDAVCATTVPDSSSKVSTFASRWLSMPACSQAAPFGAPVEPEVK